MKRKFTQLVIASLLALIPISSVAQTVLASQGFSGADAVEWTYTEFPTFYESGSSDDDWYITSAMPNISATDGNFVGGGDTDNTVNPPGFSTITFAAVNVASAEVEVSFNYHLYNYDFGDVVELEIAYDNGSDWSSPDQTISILSNAQNSPGNSGWLTSTTTVPEGNTFVRARFTLQQNGADQIGVDNFAITTTAVACSEPDVPTVAVANEVVTAGDPITLTMTGALNNATQWHAYTGACAGSPAGTSAIDGSTITVTPGSGVTTYYVRGEGGCTTPAGCGQVTVYAEGTVTTTYTGGSWNNGTPNAAYHTVIDDNYTATATMNLYSLTVNSGDYLDMDGNTLNVTTDLTLESGASFVDDGSSTISGTQSVKRFMNADALTDFHLMSVPMSDGDYEDSFQASYAYRYIGGEYNNIYAFDNGEQMVEGEGVAISGNGTAATTRTYTGTLNKGLIDYTLISSDEWHLLGNPYPAPLDLSTFYSVNNTSIRPTFYFYNESTGSYDTWNTSLNSGTGSATAYAGVAQGFFIEELTSSSTQVSYTGGMRSTNTNTFLKTAQESNTGILKLQLNATETSLAWNAEASNEDDINDAGFLQGTAATGIYSLLNDKALTIQAINNDFNSTIIPLGFYALEGGVNTIAISDLSSDENVEVILIDRYENTTHDLNASAYEFMAEISEEMIEDRFEIVLAKTSLSANENEALQAGVIVSGGNALNVISENTLHYVRVYDITGALVHEVTNINSNNFRWEGQSSAIYLIEVATENFTSNHKVLLK